MIHSAHLVHAAGLGLNGDQGVVDLLLVRLQQPQLLVQRLLPLGHLQSAVGIELCMSQDTREYVFRIDMEKPSEIKMAPASCPLATCRSQPQAMEEQMHFPPPRHQALADAICRSHASCCDDDIEADLSLWLRFSGTPGQLKTCTAASVFPLLCTASM